MKKLLITLSLLLIPNTVFGASTIWQNNGTTTTPVLSNGVYPSITIATTSTSTFQGGIISPCFATSTGANCITGGSSGGGSNYFTNNSATTSLSVGSILAAGNAVFGTLDATGTFAVNGQTTLATASSTGLTVTSTSTLAGIVLSNLKSTFLAVDPFGNVIATTTPAGGSGNSAWTVGNGFIYNATSTDKVSVGSTTSSTTLMIQAQSNVNPLYIDSTTGSTTLVVQNAGGICVGTSTCGAGEITDAGIPQPEIVVGPSSATNGNAINNVRATGTGNAYFQYTTNGVADRNATGYDGLTGNFEFDTGGVIGSNIAAVISDNNNNTGYWGFGTTTPGSEVSIQGRTGTTTLFTIASSTGAVDLITLANGNVGIGTSTPGSLLVVAGTSLFTGAVTDNSTLNVTGQTTLATASSTGLTVTATSTLSGVKLTNLSNTFLAVDPAGNVIATSSSGGTNYFTNSSASTSLNTGTNLLASIMTAGTIISTGTANVIGNALFGTRISTETATPENVSFGGTYGSNTPGSTGNLKWDLYDAGGGNLYGIGMSPGLMEFQSGSGGSHEFFVDQGVPAMMICGSNDCTQGDVGVGNVNPSATFEVQGTSSIPTNPIFIAASSTGSTTFEIDNLNHVVTGGPKPTVSGGTSSMNTPSNDNSGSIAVAGVALTSVTMTFATPWAKTPVCTESDNQTASVSDITSISTTAVVFGFSAGVTSATIWYQCSQPN